MPQRITQRSIPMGTAGVAARRVACGTFEIVEGEPAMVERE
jgi:hypothetical protein